MATLDILFITPSQFMADQIIRTFRMGGCGQKVTARSIWSFGGARAKNVVVLPFPDDWSEQQRLKAEEALQADAMCRLTVDGEFIRL